MRVRIIVAMGIAFAVAALLGALLFWRCGDARVRWLSHRVAPAAALGFVPPLSIPRRGPIRW